MILALLLSGCAADHYWYVDMPNYRPYRTIYERESSQKLTNDRCGMEATACAIRMSETCLIILGPRADACVISHEEKHCRGWSHWLGEHHSIDCGTTG